MQEIENLLAARYDDLEANVVGIQNRRDLMFAVDLAFHSALSFRFQGKIIEKGVVELLVIGDTRTGKSETVKNMVAHYGLGDFILGEACSLAGLLGGIDESRGGNRFVRCGRLPLSHRGLAIIDEANELDLEIVGKLSGMRSSGVFDIIKIINQRIPCRLRFVWIANPRSEKLIDEYAYPVEVVPEVIGRREDIARFDLATIIGKRDVDLRALYEVSHDAPKVEHRWTAPLCRNHVMFAWSRLPDQIEIDRRTEEAVLDATKDICGKYSEKIPLVVESEMRIKVARMSVATAILSLSIDEDRQRVIVTPDHVDYLSMRLQGIYDAPSMKYDVWSRKKRSTDMSNPRSDESKRADKIARALGRAGIAALLNNSRPTKSYLRTIMRNSDAGDQVWSELSLCQGLQPVGQRGGMQLTSSMIDYLQKAELREDISANPRPDTVISFSGGSGHWQDGDDDDDSEF